MPARLFAALRAALSPPALAELVRTLAIGAAGGALFFALGLPAAWLAGAGSAAAAAAIGGIPLRVPTWLRATCLVVLGIIAGSAVTPATLAMMLHWPVSLIGLTLCVGAMMVAASAYFARVHGYNAATSRLAAIPGALPYVLAMAEQCPTADVRRVAIIQVSRVAALLVLLPPVLMHLGFERPAAMPSVPVAAATLVDLVLITASSVAAGYLFGRLEFPAAWLFGPMIGTALVTGTGLAGSALPPWLTIPALVVIGTMVGANFSGLDRSLLRDTMLASLGGLLVSAAVGLAFAWPMAWAFGLPVAQVWLAYAPGGVETMAVLALALGLDVAYVGGHHVMRFLGLGVVIPFWLRDQLRRP